MKPSRCWLLPCLFSLLLGSGCGAAALGEPCGAGRECDEGICFSFVCHAACNNDADCDEGRCDNGVCAAGTPARGLGETGSAADAGGSNDAGSTDAGTSDDAGSTDAGTSDDAGSTDAGSTDAGSTDAGTNDDPGTSDDAGSGAGTGDPGTSDDPGTGDDAGTSDPGTGDDAGSGAGTSDPGTGDDAGSGAGTSDPGTLLPEDAGPINPGPAPNPCGPLQDPYGTDINGDCLGDLVIGAPGVLAPDGTTTTPNARVQVVVAKATTLSDPEPDDVFAVVTNIVGESTHGRLGSSLAIDPRRLPDGRRYLFAGEPNPLAYGRIVRFLLPLADEELSFRGKKSGWFGDGFGSSVVAAGGEGNFLSAVAGSGLTNANAAATAEGMIVTAARFEELSSAATLYTPDQLYPNATGQLQTRALFRVDDQDGDGRSDIAVSGVGLSVLGQAAGVLIVSSADLTVHTELVPPAGAHASFGWTVASTPDFDDDGQTDLAISAPKDGNGKVYIRLSGGGFLTVLPAFEEPTVRGGFGFEVSVIGDLDDDGIVDLGIGEPFWDNNDIDTTTGQPKFPATVGECQTLRGDGYTGNCAGRFSFVRGRDLADLAGGDDINAVVCARGEAGMRLGHSLAPIDEHFSGAAADGATLAIGAPGTVDEGGIVFVLRPGRITQKTDPTRWVCADSAQHFKFAYIEVDANGVISAIPGTYFGESFAR